MSTPNHHFPELQEAIQRGYHHSFTIHPDGLIECLSCPGSYYELDDIDLHILRATSRDATLYLITTRDGKFKGVYVEYWSDFSC